MKKNGFTLIELMGAIILLSLIVLVAYPAIVSVIKRSNTKIDATTESLIFGGAKSKIDENKNSYPTNNDNVYCMTIGTLVDEGYLISDLTVGNNKKIDMNLYVKVSVSDNKYRYTISDSCDEIK